MKSSLALGNRLAATPEGGKLFATGFNHGVDWNRHAVAWFLGVPCLFLILSTLFRQRGLWPFLIKGTQTRASDDLAFEIVAGSCCLYLAVSGFVARFSLFGVVNYAELQADPFYGKSSYVINHLAIPMLSYQFWNALLCISAGVGPIKMDVLRKGYMIAHHVVSAMLAYLGLHPYLSSLAPFFFGIVESTSVPLTIWDVCEKFSPVGWTDSPIYSISRIVFAISFISIRLVAWPIMCWPFWKKSVALLRSGKAHSNAVVVLFLASSAFMTFLQLLWGSEVVVGLARLVASLF